MASAYLRTVKLGAAQCSFPSVLSYREWVDVIGRFEFHCNIYNGNCTSSVTSGQ